MAKPSGYDNGFSNGFGVGRYRYELTPWQWATSPTPHWTMPSSVVGRIDLRPLAAQAAAGGSPVGFGFAASMQPLGGVSIATALHMSDENATSGMQDAWQSAMGYRPAGAKLVDLLFDQLTSGSDPDGIDGPKPLMPGVDLQLKLHVGGHSLVKSERFRFGIHPHTGKVRDLLRREFERLWEATNGDDHCRRCLDFTCKKYKVDDWKEFVPQRLHGHVPGRLPHATTLTESFNTANSGTLGPDQTWTESIDRWSVASNQASLSDGVGEVLARAESDLSSDDHYAQAAVTGLGSGSQNVQAGVMARYAAAASTGYCARMLQINDTLVLEKISAGVITNLASVAAVFSAPDTVKVEADGSTIKNYLNGAEQSSVTDTTITGNTRGGIFGFTGIAGATTVDDWEAADLAAPATHVMPDKAHQPQHQAVMAM